jgi:hypothetical protein
MVVGLSHVYTDLYALADWHAATAKSKVYSISMFELLLLGMLLQRGVYAPEQK